MSATKSASFNGTSSVISGANFTGNPTTFSVAQWVYLNASQVSRTFFSNYQSTGSKGWVTGINDTATNKPKFYLGANTLTGATALVPGIFSLVICTYDGTTAKIYLNGAATPDASLTSSIVYGTVPTNNYLGSLDAVSQWTNGLLAGVGYWSKVLSTTEMASLYNGGAGLAYADLSGSLLTSLVAYYDFTTSGSLGTDGTGSHNLTTVTNVVQVSGPGSNPNTRVSQMGLLVVDQGSPKARVSQAGVLVVDQGSPNARVSQMGLLAVRSNSPNARISQVGILTVRQILPRFTSSAQTAAM